MYKIYKIIFFYCTVLLFIGCKKATNEPIKNAVCYMQTLTFKGDISTDGLNYYYNTENNLIKKTYLENNNERWTQSYKYEKNKITINRKISTGENIVYEYILNEKRQVISYSRDLIIDSYYNYDEEGFLIEATYPITNQKTIYEYLNGNLSKKTIFFSDGKKEIYSYEYYQDKTNNMNNTGYPYIGFMGKESKNLLKSRITNNNVTSKILYTYTFDKSGNVLEETTMVENRKAFDTVIYTYKCR